MTQTWTIQTRTGHTTWATITIDRPTLPQAIAAAERLTGGHFVKIEA